jgi:hypothetical protein
VSPARATLILLSITMLLAAFGHPALAVAPTLCAVLLFVLQVFILTHRQRRTRRVIDKAVTTAQAMRDGRMAADSVVRAVQLARAEIAHAGAAEARAVLDDLEREARSHPDGVPGPIVAAARMRFDELMRANLQ